MRRLVRADEWWRLGGLGEPDQVRHGGQQRQGSLGDRTPAPPAEQGEGDRGEDTGDDEVDDRGVLHDAGVGPVEVRDVLVGLLPCQA
ncbi:MAG: hypothetical protein VX913_02595, partial [Planctomycetota bacterium]|nr:hypothetical protein [Planctomycetota bacterium]